MSPLSPAEINWPLSIVATIVASIVLTVVVNLLLRKNRKQ